MPISDINTGKELAVAYKPVVFVDFLFPDSATLYVASIAATFNGHLYDARIDDQQIERLASLSEQGIDRVPSVTIVMGDPSASIFAAYERGHGFKGASMTLRFALYDPSTGAFSTDNFVPFVGRCDQPGSDDKNLTVTASSKLNLSQWMLPQAPIQVRCLWANPVTPEQRATADTDPNFKMCGETRDLTAAPPCAYTRQTCTRPNRYSGSTWKPDPTGTGKEYLSGNKVSWRNADTSGKYKEYWPVWLGGKAWLECVPLNQRGDPNYTRGEAAVGIGEVAVSRVIVNGVELSQGGKDFYWGYSNNGARDGAPNLDVSPDGKSDPYGGLTVIEYRAPKTNISPETAASVQVLGERSVGGHYTAPSSIAIASVTAGSSGNPGPIVIHFGAALPGTGPGDNTAITITGYSLGVPANGSFIMDLLELPYDHATLRGTMAEGSWGSGTLYFNQSTQSGGGTTPGLIQETFRLCGTGTDEISGPMMSTANAICNASITTTDGGGTTYTQSRFTSSVAVRQRRSAADIVRGLRQSIGGILTVDSAGLIGIRIEGPLAEQQPGPVDGSNSNTPIVSMSRAGAVVNGFTAYRFDESNSWNLKRRPQQSAQMPNRVTFPFQDPVQEFAISTFSLVDPDDLARTGREIPGGLPVNPEGIASYNHALRSGRLGLNKIHRGNPSGDTRGSDYWEWESSFRACRLRAGDIVTQNNSRYGLTDQMVRVTEIKPSKNFEKMTIAGHHHNDSWYLDSHGNAADPAQSAGNNHGQNSCVPPSFAVEVSALDPTVAEVTGLSFTDPTNTYSITAGTFTFYFVVEATILTTLSVGINATDASITPAVLSGILAGDYLQIGREVVLCGTPSGATIPITRGQLGTTADIAPSSASIWKVQKTAATVGFPLDFVNSQAIVDWSLMQPLPDTKLLSVGGSVTNAYGESGVRYVPLTGTVDLGMKLNTPTAAGSTLVVVNPTANVDYAILTGNRTINVVATTRVVTITLPAEAANSGGLIVVNRAAGSSFDVHVIAAGADQIDGSGATVETLTATSPTWAGVAA